MRPQAQNQGVRASCGEFLRGYKQLMEKPARDRDGEIFEDDLTDNESEPDGPVREDAAETLELDPQVDSQEDDADMAENLFGLNDPKKS